MSVNYVIDNAESTSVIEGVTLNGQPVYLASVEEEGMCGFPILTTYVVAGGQVIA